MPLNSKQCPAVLDVQAERRERVAKLRLQCKPMHEIATIAGCSIATVHADIEVLRAEWRANARQSIEDHRSLQLAELERVKDHAWGTGQVQHVLQALRQQADLLGTNEPIPQDNTVLLMAMTPEERELRIEALLAERQQALAARTTSAD